MEGNVSGVDLSELMQARQELNQELGIEMDPNMYSDYNPNRARDELEKYREEQTNQKENDLNYNIEDNYESSSLGVDTDTQSQNVSSFSTEKAENFDSGNINVTNLNYDQKDFSLYDSFSQFEVPENANIISNSQEETVTNESEALNRIETNEIEIETKDADENLDTQSDEDGDSQLEDELDAIINSLVSVDDRDLSDTDETESKTEKDFETNKSDTTDLNEVDDQVFESEEKEESDLILNNDASLDEIENNDDEKVEGSKEDLNEDKEEFDELEVNNNVTSQNENNLNLESEHNEINFNNNSIRDHEIVNLIERTKSSFYTEANTQKQNQKSYENKPFYKCKFIDLIGNEEFKKSAKLSYIIGKNGKNLTEYAKLSEFFNTVIFSNYNNKSIDLIYSILFSLMLKNSTKELNLIICDNVENSPLKDFNTSGHMLFNRVTKSNKEILDVLAEVGVQLEQRYKLLAKAEAKSIEQYNESAQQNVEKMPYILCLFNNFYETTKSEEGNKILISLYPLLRLGRKVGIYFIVVSNGIIEDEKINYNLTSRIGFKTEVQSTSILEIGSELLNKLETDSEIVVLPIVSGRVLRLNAPEIDKSEIKLLMKHIEG